MKQDSHEDTKPRRDKEDLARIVVDCGFWLHKELGPGSYENVYEVVLQKMLEDSGLSVKRQISVPIEVFGLSFYEGFRADLIVEGTSLVKLKSISQLAPVHSKQVLTYLRLLDLPPGQLFNFGSATFKEGVKRIVDGTQDFSQANLRINKA
jgi:GxxExxY protein